MIQHVNPANPRVRDVINLVRKLMGGSFVNADRLEICTLIYRTIRTQHFAYEYEPPTLVADRQAVRTADDIWNDNAATCLDLACLFASLLKGAGLSSVIVIVAGPNFSHALVGYKSPAAPRWPDRPGLGNLRASLITGELVLFESTGATEHDNVVAAELPQERREGNRSLEFAAAKAAAERLVRERSDIEVTHVLEVP